MGGGGGGLQSREIHIRHGIHGYLISAGALNFGPPKGGYNIEEIIRSLGTSGVVNSRANFLGFSPRLRFPKGRYNLGKSISALPSGVT